jgi:predicted RNase H-like HicB family nuclease
MGDTRAVVLSLVLEANDDGYLASVPRLQGAFAQGDTVEEAIFNCVDVVKLIAAYRAERGESLGKIVLKRYGRRDWQWIHCIS